MHSYRSQDTDSLALTSVLSPGLLACLGKWASLVPQLSLPFPSSLLGGKGSRAAGGDYSLSKPCLGTNAFFLGHRMGRVSKRGPKHSGHHPMEGSRERRCKGQSPSSLESCPDHLISVPSWRHLHCFPQGYCGLPGADCYLSRAGAACFSVTSSKASQASNKLFKEEVRVMLSRDF